MAQTAPSEMSDGGARTTLTRGRPRDAPPKRPWRWVGRVVFLLAGAATLYVLAPQLLDVWEQVPQIETLGWVGLAAMVVLEAGSFVSVWWLHRIALPGLTWFAAATTQLTANAVSRAVPGGAAMGAGVSVRMWTIAGVRLGPAAGALAATSLISTATLLALPVVALAVAAFGAPIPRNLTVVAGGAGVLAAVLFGAGTILMTSERAAGATARLLERLTGAVARRFGRGGVGAGDLLQHRRDLLGALGPRWHAALAAAVGNWTFDYAALAAALVLLDTNPRFSLVLLAYAVAAVLTMIPITPGGLGFVEAGLTALLVVAGTPSSSALLATLAYRIVSFWLPLAIGPFAWLLFRHRYHRPLDLEHLPEPPSASPSPDRVG
jgi:uncharacterized membrane protein YbhN (UPF0104 family)